MISFAKVRHGTLSRITPRFTPWIASLCFVASLQGCGMGESRVESGNRLGILHFGNGTEPQSIDPHVSTGVPENQIQIALFEGLASKHPENLEMMPGIAERWEISEDGLIYRFFINDKARWSNGDPITAEDFRWSWQRALTPALGNLYSYMLYPIKNAADFNSGTLIDFNQVGVRVIEEKVLEVELEHPTPYFLQLTDHHSLYAVHRSSIEAHGSPYARYSDWTRPGNMVSSGPFMLTEWKMYQHVKVEPNPHYWDKDRVKLNAIYYYPTENTITEERMFRVGQLHVTNDIPVNKAQYYRENEPDLFRNNDYLGTYYYQFNLTRPPFDNQKVRRALALAIDRETLVDKVLHNVARAGYTFVPPGISGYEPPVKISYNPQEAKALLAEAGYPDGKGFPKAELLFNTHEQHRQVAVAVQQMWKETLGIEVSLVNQEWKVYLDTRNNLNYDIARAAWIGDVVDPINFLDLGLSTNGNNRSGFEDPHYDYLILEYIPSAKTEEERMQRFYEAEEYLMDQLPFIPIYTYQTRFLLDENVKGVYPNLMKHYGFKYMSLEANADD